MRLLGDTYRVARLQHSGKRGSFLLPDQAQESYSDCEVLACGPGRGLAMQARPQDRILCEPGALDGGEWVTDRALIGVIRAPRFACVEPAGGYVLVRPDPRGLLRPTASGLLVAAQSLAGDEERLRERGYALLVEYRALLDSAKYREQPTHYDRYRLESDFMDALTASEVEAFWPLLEEQRVRGGDLLPDAQDYEARPPMRALPRLLTGTVLGLGPEACVAGLSLGDRCSWSYHHRAVRITVAGALQMLVPSDALDCVLPATERVELRAAA